MAKSKKKPVVSVEGAVKEGNFKTIIELTAQHRSKKCDYTFEKELKKIAKNDLDQLVKNLRLKLLEYMEKNFVQNQTIDWKSADSEKCKMFEQIIQGLTEIAISCLQTGHHFHSHVEFALLLHSIILRMPNTMDSAKNHISLYCEKVYLTNAFENCEHFLYNVVLFLLQKTLTKKGLKVDVKRLYAIREIIKAVLQVNEAPRDELWELFKKCAASNTYLSTLEGQKIIAHIMVLDIDKILEIHKMILKSIPGITVKAATAYGKIYYEMWTSCIKDEKTEIQKVIEITCLNDIILMAINAEMKTPTLPLIRKILEQFHLHKKNYDVADMLYSLYQPVVWRYSKDPDGGIRANAAQLFLDIFPLEDPRMRICEIQNELYNQLIQIQQLLLDDFPMVRIIAVLGVCIAMSIHWEVFPEEMLKTFFKIIVEELSRDSSSSEVRIAVVRGLKQLLENPMTVKCLVSILPKVAGMFHDVNENVRIAFCQLLLRVKKISAIKYYEVVPVNQLFARMEEDSHTIKKTITNLLHNSYFPRQEDPKIWLGRCLEIIKHEREAARVFFSYVSNFISLEDCVKFMIQAAKALHYYVKLKSAPNFSMQHSNKENEDLNTYRNCLEDAVGFNNLNTVNSVIEAIIVMWFSIKTSLEKEENKPFLKLLVGKLAPLLIELCLYYKDTEVCESVFYVSSILPPSLIQTLGSLCFWKLKMLPNDAKEKDFWNVLECIVNQQQAYELLELIKHWLEAGLTDTYDPPPPPRKRRKSKRSIEKSDIVVDHDQPKPYLANRMLDCVLNHKTLQKAALKQDQVLEEMLHFIDPVKRKIERFSVKQINKTEVEFLTLLIHSLVRISVLLHDPDKIGGVKFLNEVVSWVNESLIKHIEVEDEKKKSLTSLVYSICESLCKAIGDAVAMGFVDPNSCMYLEFFERLLSTDLGHKFALITCKFLYKHAASGQYLFLMEKDTVMLQHLSVSLIKIFTHFNNEKLIGTIQEPEYSEIQFILASVMQIVHNHVERLSGPVIPVFKCILSNIIDSVTLKTSEIVNNLEENPFDRLCFPDLGAFFLSIVNQKPKLILTYVKFLTEMFESSNKDISAWIAYWMLVNSFAHSKSNQAVLKKLHTLVLSLEKCLHQLYPRENDFEENNDAESEEVTKSVPVQLFQRHCHEELIKLKNRLVAKLRSTKRNNV